MKGVTIFRSTQLFDYQVFSIINRKYSKKFMPRDAVVYVTVAVSTGSVI